MEEKERFELFGKHCIKDNSPDARCQLLDAYKVCVILNDQDKRIKELEDKDWYEQCVKQLEEQNTRLLQENQQLKQSQNQIAIEELEKLKEEMVLNGSNYCEIRQGTSPHNPSDYYAWFNYVVFRKFIDNRIKKLKGVDKDE